MTATEQFDREQSSMEPTSTPFGATEITAAIEARVGYLRIALDAPPADGWASCADLISQPDQLLASIESTVEGRGAPDLQVAASLWFQAYAFRVALPVLAPFALGLDGLSSDPADTAIRIARNRPAAIAVTDPTPVARTAADAAQHLLADHLGLVVEAIVDQVTVGRRLLWGNAAASCATVFRALEGAPDADRPAIRERADQFGVAAAPWLDGLGWYDVVAEAGQEGWYWTRTNCCLWERCDGTSRCDDCSLTSAADLETARRAALATAAAAAVEVAS